MINASRFEESVVGNTMLIGIGVMQRTSPESGYSAISRNLYAVVSFSPSVEAPSL